MKIRKIALYAVLMVMAGFFTSCDNSNEPEIQVQDEVIISPVAPKMRSSTANAYKQNISISLTIMVF